MRTARMLLLFLSYYLEKKEPLERKSFAKKRKLSECSDHLGKKGSWVEGELKGESPSTESLFEGVSNYIHE